MSLKGLITPMKTKAVAVLFGGQSSEHDISDMSACFIINNIDNEKYDVLKIGITRDGKWWLYTGTTDSICSHFWQDDTSNLLPCVISPCSAHHGIIIFDKKNEKYAIKHIDVVFPALHGKNGEVSIPKPFERDIFLFDTYVAGTSHVEGIEELEPHLQIGDRLAFFREPENPYDAQAIVIKTTDGVKIGYVPRQDNVIFARLMDAGKLLFGKITEKEKKGKWVRISIDIFLHE